MPGTRWEEAKGVVVLDFPSRGPGTYPLDPVLHLSAGAPSGWDIFLKLPEAKHQQVL